MIKIPTLILSLFLFCQVPLLVRAQQTIKPNIILIISDDHGTDDLGCYGNESIKTPNLDYLAEQGTKFTRAYANTASCSPSRASIYTGLFSHANGAKGLSHHEHDFQIYHTVRTLPFYLEKAGYTSAHIGKFHNNKELFEDWQFLSGDSKNPVAMADSSAKFIRNHKGDPFFLSFCTTDPHRGGGVLEDDPLKPNRFHNKDEGYPGVKTTRFSTDQVEVPYFLPDIPETRSELAQYYESVHRVDQGIGRLIEHLKNEGVWENTVVFYISDNGIAFPGAKTTTYEPGLRLPCIVRYPQGTQIGATSTALVNWADITPTILDITGSFKEVQTLPGDFKVDDKSWDAPPSFDAFHGRSFKGILEKGVEENRNETYASHTFHEVTMYYPMRVVITKNYKLIWNMAYGLAYPHASDLWSSCTWQALRKDESNMFGQRQIISYLYRPEFELYHLSEDPFETNNLAGVAEYRAIFDLLKEKIQQFQIDTQDPWIVKWEHE